MKKIINLLKEKNITPYRITIKGKTTLIDSKIGSFIIKKNETNKEVMDYLKSRNFDYYPNILFSNKDYEALEYINETKYPNEQKLLDLINLVALLHSKTTYYKEINLDYYKQIYEDINNNIIHLESYYDDMVDFIETHIYMNPYEYLLIRNIKIFYNALEFCKNNIETWYDLVKNKEKQRVVIIHNNLKLDHFLKKEKSYLISWNKAKFDIPIFDLFKLYNNINIDFTEAFKKYEQIYPLKEEERLLFFILIALPHKIEFNNDIYKMIIKINNEIKYILKTERFISPYYMKQNEQNN